MEGGFRTRTAPSRAAGLIGACSNVLKVQGRVLVPRDRPQEQDREGVSLIIQSLQVLTHGYFFLSPSFN